MTQKLSFCFKGSRTYIHGTDIVNAVFKTAGDKNLTQIDIKFNGISLSNLDLIEGDKLTDAKVNLRWLECGVERNYQLIENGETVECRYEYDEDQIINKTKLDLTNQTISLGEVTNYTLCENFVAMNRFLLEHLYPVEKGKWYFTRLEQSRAIPDDSLIEVKLIKNFNFRLTKSDILVDGEVVGSVYFTMVRGK